MTKRKPLITSLLVLIVMIGAIAALEVTDTTHIFHHPKTADPSRSTDVSNATPSTNTDRTDTETQKSTKPDVSTNTQTNTSSLRRVDVEVTTQSTNTAGVSVNGFVGNVVEEGGTCTLTATAQSDDKVLSSSRPAEPNVTNTTCGMTSIDKAKFHSGIWKLVLSYKSATSIGSSDPLEITI